MATKYAPSARAGIILSGGPESVTDSRPPAAPQAVFEAGVPVLGICYGMQTMAQQLGGRVTPSGHREFGYAQVTVTAPCRLLEGLRDHDDPQGRAVLDVWMSHGDRVDALPPGFAPVGASANAPLAAMADEIAALLRRAVPPRGHPHAAGRADDRALRARDLRLRGALAAGQHHRRRGGAGARAGGRRSCPARAVRRRRLIRGRGAAQPRDR